MHSGSVLAQALGWCSLTRVVQNQPERQKFVQNPQNILGHQSIYQMYHSENHCNFGLTCKVKNCTFLGYECKSRIEDRTVAYNQLDWEPLWTCF